MPVGSHDDQVRRHPAGLVENDLADSATVATDCNHLCRGTVPIKVGGNIGSGLAFSPRPGIRVHQDDAGESRGGVSPPRAPRTVRDTLASYGSRCSAIPMQKTPMRKQMRAGGGNPAPPPLF